ncbi:NAD(P)H azoreductase [Arthrobacter sp. SO5]|uniref:NAD(P)H-binding protein n=1 Tax=Arthrobacter sp. SO5 TaxID=1897055 RepID=UPI001E63FEF8|nr:NAD(P)H-binding protein [Arthrobacter sp. SO5]MCB5275397.1 NAD(P)H azoreductase [Arthrobacter sp. SO5]
MKTFLIVGGTGKVGSRLAEVLRGAGHGVRVASRSGGDVRFDWREPGTYVAALHGVDGVFLVGPGSATDWSPALGQLLNVAASEGVKRAVLLSARGVEFLPDGAVGRAEKTLAAGPIPWTVLRPSHFAQNFTEAMFVPINGQILAPVADGAEPFIDVKDSAEVAAEVLTNASWENQTVEISGPSALTFDEAAAILTEHAGRRLSFIDEDPDQHARNLRAAGTPEGYITWRMAMLGGIRRGDDAYISNGVERVLGRPATSFAGWAAREGSVLGLTSA